WPSSARGSPPELFYRPLRNGIRRVSVSTVTILSVTLRSVRNGARDGAHSVHPGVDPRRRPRGRRPDPWPFAGAGPGCGGTGGARATLGPSPTARWATIGAGSPTASPAPGRGSATYR